MRDRPIYIGLLCWYLIIANTWALIHAFHTFNSPAVQGRMAAIPLPLPVQTVQYFAAIVVPLVTAAFMTNGANWARVVYIGWGIANYLLEAIVVPTTKELFPSVTIFAFASILLLLPAPRGYFLLPQHHT
jgi:hypothetical protein